MLRRLYDWTLSLAARPSAPYALALVSFAESSFFPVPPDVMLVPMMLARPDRAWSYALICTVASVVGGILGYLIGYDIEHRAVPPAAAARHVQEMTSAYLAGLQRHGWSGDERAVRFVRAATAALQMVPLFGAEISWLDDTSPEEGVEPGRWPEQVAERHGISVPELMSGWANNFTLMLDLGDEARRLAAQLF